MRLAIAGAGFAGLAACYYALEEGFEVTLFDPLGIGIGASGASTGLLHPFVGKTASLSWQGHQAMEESKKLLLVAKEALRIDVASYTGIFRPAVTKQQKQDFQKNQEAIWKEVTLPGVKDPISGLWIESGITVFSQNYLEGLWLACLQKGAQFVQEPFSSGDSFDRVILAAGDKTRQFPSCKDLAYRTAIGQSLLCRSNQRLLFSMSSQKYIALTQTPGIYQVGSTYEHTKKPDPQKAYDLLENVASFYPPARDFEILEIRSGIRIAPKAGHKPIVEQISPKTWVFTGLGSRGLLYHAYLGRQVALQIGF